MARKAPRDSKRKFSPIPVMSPRTWLPDQKRTEARLKQIGGQQESGDDAGKGF